MPPDNQDKPSSRVKTMARLFEQKRQKIEVDTSFDTPWRFRNPDVYKGTEYPNSLDIIQFHLSPQAKELFEQGKPGQGYVGLADLITGEIQLIPTFNAPRELVVELDDKGRDKRGPDGKPIQRPNAEVLAKEYFSDKTKVANKHGEFFSCTSHSGIKRDKIFATTSESPGHNTGKAHGTAVALAGFNQASGNQTLIGFGLWKGDTTLIHEFRDRSSSQNMRSIEFHHDFNDHYLSDEFKSKNRIMAAEMKLQRERSLPQEIGDKLIEVLLDELPLEPGQHPSVNHDGRARYLTNPFHEAIQKNDLETVKKLLNRNMYINEIAQDEEHTGIVLAAKLGHVEIMKHLIQHPNINTALTDSKDRMLADYITPSLAKTLISTIEKQNPLEAFKLALMKEQFDIAVRLMTLHEFQLDSIMSPIDSKANERLNIMILDLEDYKKLVEDLKKAIQDDDADLVKECIEEMTIHNDRINDKQETPLIYASRKGALEVVAMLSQDSTIDVGARDIEGKSFVDYLSHDDSLKMAKILLKSHDPKGAAKICLLAKDFKTAQDIMQKHALTLTDLNDAHHSYVAYCPPQLKVNEAPGFFATFFKSEPSNEELFSKMIKQEMTDLLSQAQHLNRVELELMEINETLVGIRDIDMDENTYFEQLPKKVSDKLSQLHELENYLQQIEETEWISNLSMETPFKALRESLNAIHSLEKDIDNNLKARLEEPKAAQKPKPTA